MPHQSDSDQNVLSSLRPRPLLPGFAPDVPGADPLSTCAGIVGVPVGVVRSPPRPAVASACIPVALACGGTANIPLQPPQQQGSIFKFDIGTIVPLLSGCIDMTVAIIHMQIAMAEAYASQATWKRKKKRRMNDAAPLSYQSASALGSIDGQARHHAHAHQVNNLLACLLGIEDAKWYVKPRSTCWFDQYLFEIYTPDMFYDILRMRRRTFDKLVHDLRPYIQGQPTHWRQPISVEKKVVVTLFKLMHGVCIPLVADRAALGKSTVYGILRQVCCAVSKNFGHLIAWPAGRRLARVTAAFQSKQQMPNCIGAIDGSHVYIAAPPNSIVAADHRNRNKTFSILLQAVVDTNCYFTSVNAGPPGSLHDSAHFRSTELYRRVEEGVMAGFHDDPMEWPAALPFPPYIVADRGYPLLSWCITPFKMGPMGNPLSHEEVWFNRKHSSTRMCVERGFGILKARFKEIGTKSALKLDFVPTVVHACCILHNILIASKDRTLDQILRDCHLPPMEDIDPPRAEEENVFRPPRPMGLVSEERALLEGKMAREDLLDYLVRTQNQDYMSRHPSRPAQ